MTCPDHVATGMKIEQANDDADALPETLQRAVEKIVCIRIIQGVSVRCSCGTAATQEIQRKRDTAAVISSARPGSDPSCREPSNVRGGSTQRRIPCLTLFDFVTTGSESCARGVPRINAAVSGEGSRPTCSRALEHRSKASRAAARSPCSSMRADQGLPRAFVHVRSIVNNCSAAAIRALSLAARNEALPPPPTTPVASPADAVPRASRRMRDRAHPDHRAGWAETPAGLRIRGSRSSRHTHIDPESVVEQDQVVAVRMQQGTRCPVPAHAAVRAPTAAMILSPAPWRAGSRAARSACCAAPALAPPVPAPPAPPGSCAIAAARCGPMLPRRCI